MKQRIQKFSVLGRFWTYTYAFESVRMSWARAFANMRPTFKYVFVYVFVFVFVCCVCVYACTGQMQVMMTACVRLFVEYLL